MALFSRIRTSATAASFHLRRFSILSADSPTPLSAHQKTRAALCLLKSEQNPDRILNICRAASLTPTFHLDRIAFSVAISKLSEGNHFQSIDTFLRELNSRPDLQHERFVSHSLILYGQAKMLNHALTTFDEFYNKGYCRSTKSLNALLVAAILAKDYKEAKRIFVEFPKREGNLEEAKRLFKSMVNKGLKPDSHCYFTLVYFLCQSGDFETALRFCKESMEKNWVPNFSTMKALVKGLASISKVEEAKELIKNVKEKFSKNADAWDEIEKDLPQ
ncbi:hypothetical protein ERO13_A09G069200v2 [Gossypium hirsutum]|uniref:Pentacotripeptide-repeat region of PRORP domain-containing protein n=2 Tax=Gossypium TaxID=3633 RepID=A0A5D2XVE0_GOSMU|nr:hypothetical protein ERO13_A09G069200v2 [Gossypium hirsutum]TYI09619.1 hypothetical protein ES332_A09G086000v1 [Gossypium tomentosum]TYJ17780.1 hypothetical protein E1A91_A09G076400v1 [Gossypium mustelinum]KAG4182814.1 hypothetical protein ERO13_A09G069200v2 [Gossypium hirsutum]KAG4182815.1 hypothetical protein ERO13_A09G069200v2 [Gossypium hirsutum]